MLWAEVRKEAATVSDVKLKVGKDKAAAMAEEDREMLEVEERHAKIRFINLGVLGARQGVTEILVSWEGGAGSLDTKMSVKQLLERELRWDDVPLRLRMAATAGQGVQGHYISKGTSPAQERRSSKGTSPAQERRSSALKSPSEHTTGRNTERNSRAEEDDESSFGKKTSSFGRRSLRAFEVARNLAATRPSVGEAVDAMAEASDDVQPIANALQGLDLHTRTSGIWIE